MQLRLTRAFWSPDAYPPQASYATGPQMYPYPYGYAVYGQGSYPPAVYAQHAAPLPYSTYTPHPGVSASLLSDSDVDPLAAPKTVSDAEKDGGTTAEQKKHLRYAAGHVWEDTTLAEWPENDFRIHVGNLGNEVDDKTLHEAFKKYPSLAHWKVIKDKKYDAPKGYGFVSFTDPRDGVRALKEMNGKYVGQRPCKLSKSTYDKRDYGAQNKRAKK